MKQTERYAPILTTETTGHIESVSMALADAGIDAHALSETLLQRLAHLNETTHTVKDEHESVLRAQEIFESTQDISSEELQAVREGTMFSDIGKNGPPEATEEQSDVIAHIYSIDEKFNTEKTTIADFLERFFPLRKNEMSDVLQEIHITENMSMRAFFNMHTQWSFDILKDEALTNDGKLAAGLHHTLEGVIPTLHGEPILSKEGVITGFGANRMFGIPEALVLLLDKYDAQLVRSDADHTSAITWLRTYIDTYAKLDHFTENAKTHITSVCHDVVDIIDTQFATKH